MNPIIPIVLFVYNRPDHLRRTLVCLRENHVPFIYAFADGPKVPESVVRVQEVRRILRQVDWCEMQIVEREENLGLGRSILTGMDEVFQRHDMAIVFEDDLVCVPGTYQYLCAALEKYRSVPNVMSVTGFNHPLNTPKDVTDQPYFDGRAECWSWGAWARSWDGMNETAATLMRRCQEEGIDPYKYGGSLPEMAKNELRQNIWAVRFFYLHMLKNGLCLRPPFSMVEHIGFDSNATNAREDIWPMPKVKECPPLPTKWPIPVEHPEASILWRQAESTYYHSSKYGNIKSYLKQKVRKTLNKLRQIIYDLVQLPFRALRKLESYIEMKKDIKLFLEKYGNNYREISGYRSVHGFLTDDQAVHLYNLAKALPESPLCVEIGSWQGKSSILIAKGIQNKKNAKLVCIDPFDATGDTMSEESAYRPYLQALPKLFQFEKSPLKKKFLRNIRKNKVENMITVLQGYSQDYSPTFSEQIDLLFIDGNHEYDAVKRDFREWSTKLKINGLLIIHDVDFDPYKGPSGNEDQLGPGKVAQEFIIHSKEWRNITMVDNMLVAIRC